MPTILDCFAIYIKLALHRRCIGMWEGIDDVGWGEEDVPLAKESTEGGMVVLALSKSVDIIPNAGLESIG